MTRSIASTRVVVVGAGLAGLAAAHRLAALAALANLEGTGPAGLIEIVVCERGDRPGGKIRTGLLAGQSVEAGAETFLTSEAGAESAVSRLARELGLELVHPAAVPAALALGGTLRAMPAGTLMGIPADPSTLDGLVTVGGSDVDGGAPLLSDGADIAVGALVRDRFGDDVVDRLVDPLLGGVYAGRADRLSLAATIPALHTTAQTETTLAAAVRAAQVAARRPVGAPVFASVRGGLGRLVDALTDAAAVGSGVRVRTGVTVRALTRHGAGWRLVTGPTRDEGVVEADAVILAVPGPPAARLLAGVAECAGAAAACVGSLEYASVGLVTLALPPGTRLPELSGFLVPATEGFAVKAATFFSTKWPNLRGPDAPVLVRASLGRFSDHAVLQRTDDDLVDLARRELTTLLGTALPPPLAATVTRWGGGLPQYPVGHVERTAALRSALPPTLAVAGAAYDGVGLAACVRSGQTAAEAVWRDLEQSSS